MMNSAKYFVIVIGAVLSLSACTMGDKGSEKVPDSVSIDTNMKAEQPASTPSDTTLIDSLQTDTTSAGKKP
ncbi:MAG: hypothetical protein MUP99_04845 [Pedobacter sp.]|nr:hypothetical protein [Pedobacter sp.]